MFQSQDEEWDLGLNGRGQLAETFDLEAENWENKCVRRPSRESASHRNTEAAGRARVHRGELPVWAQWKLRSSGQQHSPIAHVGAGLRPFPSPPGTGLEPSSGLTLNVVLLKFERSSSGLSAGCSLEWGLASALMLSEINHIKVSLSAGCQLR